MSKVLLRPATFADANCLHASQQSRSRGVVGDWTIFRLTGDALTHLAGDARGGG